ncbi:MAG: TIGR03862 family flavoprotein [Devosia sp.]
MARIGIIGAGPAGLMAAETLAGEGHTVIVYDAMPTVARKFLMAGKSGLNLTHAEPHERLLTRYGPAGPRLRQALDGFTAADLTAWCAGLGIETFVGSSGRVFPTAMKASPLLRAWLGRLAEKGVTMRTRHRWTGMSGSALLFETPAGPTQAHFDAVLLALGGASWPRLGSDAAWVPWLSARGVAVSPFQPANCGFRVSWSSIFADRFAGAPVKSVRVDGDAAAGEFVVTASGIEGSLVYAHSARLRDMLAAEGSATLTLDLTPDRPTERLAADLARQPRQTSFANRLRKGARLEGLKAGLLRECIPDAAGLDPSALAHAIKHLPLRLSATQPIDRAISSAGGIAWSGIDPRFMLRALPGVFVAGEMLDWEAPTGGYLLTACVATGRAAALGLLDWLAEDQAAGTSRAQQRPSLAPDGGAGSPK